ncbi:MAG: nucleotide exchange factor GrpE [Clostridiales bacterium]|jgi:molecular chaperone GrpE|nr:nucleotide exchange factor GrpE [Clostridiales bacterium]
MAKQDKSNDRAHEPDDLPEEADTQEISVDELIDKLAALQERAEAEQKKAEEMKDTALRLQAEFDNYRKRTNETNKRVREDGRLEVLEKVIPLLDVIEQAMGMIGDKNVLSGMRMVQDQMRAVLTAFGIERMETDGEYFDPRFHEAILQVDAEGSEEKDTIRQTVQAGYTLGERVVRAARVIVVK